MSCNQDITILQGSDFELAIQLVDDTGAIIDLTGCTGTGQIRQTVGSVTILATFSFALEDNNKAIYSLTNVITAGLPVPAQTTAEKVLGEYAYDVEITWPSLKKDRIAEGIAYVSPEVTR